jgi:hypothetical protein
LFVGHIHHIHPESIETSKPLASDLSMNPWVISDTLFKHCAQGLSRRGRSWRGPGKAESGIPRGDVEGEALEANAASRNVMRGVARIYDGGYEAGR